MAGRDVARVGNVVHLNGHASHYTRSLFRIHARLEHRLSALRAGHGRANRRADSGFVRRPSRRLRLPAGRLGVHRGESPIRDDPRFLERGTPRRRAGPGRVPRRRRQRPDVLRDQDAARLQRRARSLGAGLDRRGNGAAERRHRTAGRRGNAYRAEVRRDEPDSIALADPLLRHPGGPVLVERRSLHGRRPDLDYELPDDRGPPHRTGAHLGAARASEAMKTPRALLTPPVGPRDHVLGPADARVTLVEDGDFECPFCGAAYPELKRVLGELGPKVRFVFRHFPLGEAHPHAPHAAEVAEAAAAQGTFWRMHDLLYQRQAALADEDLVAYARELGLDADRVRRELADHTHAARVREDFLSGVRSGVSGTPRFFINGRPHEEPGDAKTLAVALRRAL